MNFALIGFSPLTRQFLKAIDSHPDFDLRYLITCNPADPDLIQQFPSLQIRPEWETLLQGNFDLVILTGSSEHDLQAARKLYSHRQPIALCPLYRMQAEFIYELSLIQDDNQTLLVPILPGSWQPQIEQLHLQFLQKSVFNLNWERSLPQAWLRHGTVAEQQNVINEWLLNDLMLLRKLGGAYNQVTAMRTEIARKSTPETGSAEDLAQITHLSVTLTGADLPPVCWTLKQAGELQAELKYTTFESEHLLRIEEQNQLRNESVMTPAARIDQSMAEQLLMRLADCVHHKSADPDLRELTRGFETVDAVQRSIRRRRTVDLYFETTSERSQFKSQMTAVGCGVLLLTPVLLVVRLMLGVMLPDQLLLLKLTGVLVFAPLFLFLIIQLLIFLAQPAANQQ